MINATPPWGRPSRTGPARTPPSSNLYDVIWAQHIWTPVRSSEGWRSMPDRGSPTANHYDHVHISVN